MRKAKQTLRGSGVVLMIILLTTNTADAQRLLTKKYGWWTNASAGLVVGASNTRPLLQGSGGFRTGRHLLGVGAGYDWYREESVPVFADWRVHFGKSRSVFVYANAGHTFLKETRQPINHMYLTTNTMRGGFYSDAGLGYRIPFGRTDHGLSLSAGYSTKNVEITEGYTYPCLTPPCDEVITKYNHRYNRLTARLSWQFIR